MMLIARIAEKKNVNHLMVEAAKSASYKHNLLVDYNYPRPFAIPPKTIEPALAYAIIRQESVFETSAISSANAHGLMQIIPPTASETAKAVGIRYSRAKLTRDWKYNVTLGTKYMRNLINDFDGSYILAIASYNAGPHNVAKWLEQNGDPREMRSFNSIINWIESIPFHETRNYVQRVLENLQIYRHVMNEEQKLEIIKDLKR